LRKGCLQRDAGAFSPALGAFAQACHAFYQVESNQNRLVIQHLLVRYQVSNRKTEFRVISLEWFRASREQAPLFVARGRMWMFGKSGFKRGAEKGLLVTLQEHRHRIPDHLKVVGHPVLGGLHHEYEIVTKAV